VNGQARGFNEPLERRDEYIEPERTDPRLSRESKMIEAEEVDGSQ